MNLKIKLREEDMRVKSLEFELFKILYGGDNDEKGC